MDQPGLDVALHRGALDGLRRINWLSRTTREIWRPISELAREADICAPLRILDIASGGGDVAIGLAMEAAASGVAVEIEGCDISSTAISYARNLAAQSGLLNVTFRQLDVLQDALPPDFDIVTCSLFLHHLADSEAEGLLARMAVAARRMVVISDLRRSRIGFLLAQLVCRTLTRSPVVRVDGPLSVAAAFTCSEALDLAQRSGLAGARINTCWPQRFLLTWKPPQ